MPLLLLCPHCGFSRSWSIRRDHRRCKRCRKEWSPKRQRLAGRFHFSQNDWRRIVSVFLGERTSGRVAARLDCSLPTAKKAVRLLRKIMAKDTPVILAGTCEADETYFEGAWRNLRNPERLKRRGTRGRKTKKLCVFGVVSRTQRQAILRPIPNARRPIILQAVRATVVPGSTVYTDGHWPYRHLPKFGYQHDWVDHEKGEYARGEISTQMIEGLWGVMKRRLKAIGGVRRIDLPIFLGEQLWRYNFRHLTHEEQIQRLVTFLTKIGGKI